MPLRILSKVNFRNSPLNDSSDIRLYASSRPYRNRNQEGPASFAHQQSSSLQSPPYINRAPHLSQNTFIFSAFAPHFVQNSGISSMGEHFTQERTSGLYMTSLTHLPHLWQRLKCRFPSFSQASINSFCGSEFL